LTDGKDWEEAPAAPNSVKKGSLGVPVNSSAVPAKTKVLRFLLNKSVFFYGGREGDNRYGWYFDTFKITLDILKGWRYSIKLIYLKRVLF
jgi:hypothetical protein